MTSLKEGVAITAVSLDSRSRIESDPDYDYRISLGRPLENVKSVQLASFQFQEARFAIPTPSNLYLSEPITIPPNTQLQVTETTTTFDKITNSTSSTSKILTLHIPPSINPLTGYTDNASPALDVVICQYNTGLLYGITYYQLLNLNMFVAGANFPTDISAFPPNTSFPTGAGPIVNFQTIEFPYVGPTGLANEFQYKDDYITELSGAAVGHALRHFLAANYTSFVIAPKVTITETLIMLNAACNDLLFASDITGLVTGATFATPIVITTPASHGLKTGDQIVVSGVLGNTGANGTFFITVVTLTTFSLNGSVGTAAYVADGTWLSPQRLTTSLRFKIDDDKGQIVAMSTPKNIENQTSVVKTQLLISGGILTVLGFNSSNVLNPNACTISLPFNVQTFPLRPGTYNTYSSLASMVTDQLQILEFFDHAADKRRFVYSTASGWFVSVLVESGFYTGPQLAAHLNVKLIAIGATVRFSFSTVTRRFTLTDQFAQNFILDCTIIDTRFVFMLGFHPLRYSGKSSYTSDFPILASTFGIATDNVYPTNAYIASSDDATRCISVNVAPKESFWSVDGTYTAGVNAKYETTWNTLCLPFANRYDVGEVLYAQRPVGAGVITAVTVPGGGIFGPVLATSVAHGLVDGDRVALLCFPGIVWVDCVFSITSSTAPFPLDQFFLDNSVFTGTYNPATPAEWMSVSTGGATQVEPPILTVVVKGIWNPTVDTVPTVTLEATPTTAAFGAVTTTDRVILHGTSRNVFQMHFPKPEGVGPLLGFPSVTWPPTSLIDQTVLKSYWNNNTFPLGASVTSGPQPTPTNIPISSGYTSPFAVTLLPQDYFYMCLKQCGQDNNTFTWKGDSTNILAKLYVTWPYLTISEELNVSFFTKLTCLKEIHVCFKNPDGSPMQFNGVPHNYTLLFTMVQGSAAYICK